MKRTRTNPYVVCVLLGWLFLAASCGRAAPDSEGTKPIDAAEHSAALAEHSAAPSPEAEERSIEELFTLMTEAEQKIEDYTTEMAAEYGLQPWIRRDPWVDN